MGNRGPRREAGAIGRRFHLHALALLIAVVAGWLTLMVVAARDAELTDNRAGMVTAVFPFRTSIKDVFLALDRAGGSIVADTWFPNVWVLYSETPGYARRLREGGALLVLDVAPFQTMTIPSCGGV